MEKLLRKYLNKRYDGSIDGSITKLTYTTYDDKCHVNFYSSMTCDWGVVILDIWDVLEFIYEEMENK